MKHLALNWRVGVLGLIISGVAAYLTLSQVNLSRLHHDLTNARYGYALACGAILMLGLLARALRWRALLDNRLPAASSFGILGIGYLLNSLVPLRAGELARVVLASGLRLPIPALTTASTIVVERLLDMLALLIVLALTLAAAPLPPEIRAAAVTAAPVVLLGFITLVILAHQRSLAERLLTAALGHVITPLRRFDLAAWALNFLDGLKPLAAPRKLLVVLGWTALSWGCTIAAGYTLMFALYDAGNWFTASLFIGVLAFAVALPAVPGNLGTYELAIVTVLQATGYGEPANLALAFAVLLHAVDIFVYILAGLYGFVQQGMSFGQLSRAIQAS